MSSHPRILVPGPLAGQHHYSVEDEGYRHLVQVLRLRVGDALTLFDGSGLEYPGRLSDIGKRRAEVELGSSCDPQRESPLQITLLQGVSKGERMDYSVQKATELGVSRIVPVITEFCVVRLDGERWERKLEHWRAVAGAACEQSGRTRIPQILHPVGLNTLIDAGSSADGCDLLLDPLARTSIAAAPRAGAYRLLIGPEGGLSPGELARATAAGFIGMRMGPRILRTETAGPVAIAALQLHHGDLMPDLPET